MLSMALKRQLNPKLTSSQQGIREYNPYMPLCNIFQYSLLRTSKKNPRALSSRHDDHAQAGAGRVLEKALCLGRLAGG